MKNITGLKKIVAVLEMIVLAIRIKEAVDEGLEMRKRKNSMQ